MSTRLGVFPVLVILLLAFPIAAAGQAPPKILWSTSPRAIEYQLGRLTNAELLQVDRRADDPKYRLVYVALLTRKGLGREYFDEALGALVKLDKISAARVLLEALPKVRADDEATADKLLRVLFTQPPDALRKEREAFAKAIEAPESPLVLRAAYGVMMTADGNPLPAWQVASKRDGHLVELLRAIPQLSDTVLRGRLFEPVATLLKDPQDAPTRGAALSALGWTRQDPAVFRLLAQEVVQGGNDELRAAAVRSLQRLPKASWPPGEIEPLARAIVASVQKLPADRRTDAGAVESIQLGEKLADALPDEARRAIRRDLRGLGVQAVRIEAVPEQMMFDLKWFAVEAGKPVQIVFYNPDAMSHNLLIVAPGSLKEVGMAASTMAPSSDPKVKPYVPDSPLVLQSTRLLNWAETERLSFAAPKEPGEYPFVCTFPGHWVRMYGVMLVVPNLETWESTRTPPRDPMTTQAYPR
jgi:azurin